MTKSEIIKMFSLEPLEGEGGWFRRTYESALRIASDCPECGSADGGSVLSSAIYYLLGADEHSAMHALKKSDEIWHFYASDSPSTRLKLACVNPDTWKAQIVCLGADFSRGDVPQFVVPAGFFMGAKIEGGSDSWVLCGTTVSPGFEYSDFILADAQMIALKTDSYADFIKELS